MSVTVNLRFLPVLLFAGCVAADTGDDFSNNLFSDLAPLLALFGERVTMQFMSQSMGWADNIILAMAPLGIITTIISAIRVGGPSWLKAIIGRARENLAAAEAELMSSTSKEVCELWNGHEVSSGNSKVEMVELKEAQKRGYLEDVEDASQNSSEDSKAEQGQAATNRSRPEIIIVRNKAADAPNISLNAHNQFGRGELRAVAAIGTLLQLGVLLYCGFATYYPTVKFKKDGRPIASYAFPCTAVGTLVLVAATVLGIKAVLGTMVSLCGFVVQFVGLRGMHWSASVVQLGAVLVMSVLRAWVRRGLAKPPQCERLPPGFELEWFATTLGDLDKAPWLATTDSGKDTTTSNSEEQDIKDWTIVTDETSEMDEKPGQPSENDDSDAHTVMMIRRNLGELAGWHGPASAEAISLARAIEVTMTALFGSSHKNLTWSLETHGKQLLKFRLERQENGLWKAYADEIEAALSLRLYSVNKIKQADKQAQGSRTLKDDAWLRAKGSTAKRSLRILGLSTTALLRDLRWWMTGDAPRILAVKKAKEGMLEVENHRVVGRRQQLGKPGNDRSGTNSTSQHKIHPTRFDVANMKVDDEDDDKVDKVDDVDEDRLLAIESHEPLKLLYAQDMFSAFMWAVAKSADPVKGNANIQPDDISSDNAWQSFKLQNNLLLTMAQDIENTGLGSLDQIYLSIIPPLSMHEKLPQPNAIVELARQHAKQHEQLQHWKQAGDAHLWLFRTARTFPEHSGIATKATAVLMEYLRTVTQALELREDQQYDDRDFEQLKDLKSTLERELRTVGRGILSSLIRLYEEQGRGWKCVPVQEARSGWEEEAANPKNNYNWTPLHYAVAKDTGYTVIELLKHQANVNAADLLEWTPLHYAVAKDTGYTVIELLKHQANVNAPDLLEWTPLHYACQRNETSVVQNLFREGAELDVRGRDGVAPLHCAAMNGCVDVVRSLIEAGATLDILDASGNTPLHLASQEGHKGVVEYLWQDSNKKLRDRNGWTALHLALLVEKGAEIDAKDGYGKTPLHWAAKNGHKAIARLLVEKGAEIDAKDGYDGRTPLHWAAKNGHEAIARLLVEKGAEIDTKDVDNRTPLHLAAENGHEAIARLLVEKGAKIDAKDGFDGRTPLHWAAKNGHEAIARLLVEKGAEIDAKDGFGRTPLHLAAENGHEAIARLLVEKGAEIDAKDGYGKTPLHWAAKNGHEAIARLLVEKGAEIDAKDGYDRTPLHLAAENGHEAIARLLVEKGAEIDAKDLFGRTPLQGAKIDAKDEDAEAEAEADSR
ncbi:ankyrin repeat-containing domain protein [Phialemonium atrogriseum]|uniref:Ankyrin repeat-containing domain protein n=1 Tax=Phialemonium atrogriseum TaxID=1093897 RepID=A0AAJ0FJC9_9PEZI|nr:ankyrin repeat-containing domain protein [Phialemonium atrogriseum]KAK1770501.1 ankyrin repeat-containing domain protein [Phialemonium atrogriseum]